MGRFILDVFVPKMELLIDQPDARLPFGEYDDPDGSGRIVVTESYVYEPDTQIKRITRVFVRRQANWFKNDDERIKWFEAGDAELFIHIEREIHNWLSKMGL